MRKLVKHIMC